MNDYRDYLMHHGVLGQKWGVRRYRNSDGSLTDAGRKRYNSTNMQNNLNNGSSSGGANYRNAVNHLNRDKTLKAYRKQMGQLSKEYERTIVEEYNKRVDVNRGYKKAKTYGDKNYGRDYDALVDAYWSDRCESAHNKIDELNNKIRKQERNVARNYIDKIRDAKSDSYADYQTNYFMNYTVNEKDYKSPYLVWEEKYDIT